MCPNHHEAREAGGLKARGPAGFAKTLLFLMLMFWTYESVYAATFDELKAVFIFNFTQFVTWPDVGFQSKDSTFRICTLGGSESFGKALDSAVSGESHHKHPIVVYHLQDAVQTADCHIVFLSNENPTELQQLFLTAYQKPILTVSDVPGFPEKGGIIGFSLKDRRLRLRINVEAAQRSNLTISSKLLRLCEVVQEEK